MMIVHLHFVILSTPLYHNSFFLFVILYSFFIFLYSFLFFFILKNLVEISYGNYECTFTPIEALVYTEFHPDTFQVSLTEVFNVYLTAFRSSVLVTVYHISPSFLFSKRKEKKKEKRKKGKKQKTKNDTFQASLTEVFNVYLTAFRSSVLVTVYHISPLLLIETKKQNAKCKNAECNKTTTQQTKQKTNKTKFYDLKRYCIAGFIAFYLLLDILLNAVFELLKRLDAMKINRKRWYLK
jgi:hypothetical protein